MIRGIKTIKNDAGCPIKYENFRRSSMIKYGNIKRSNMLQEIKTIKYDTNIQSTL